eukprot:jgi/Botrbrau1/2790/Bobra.0125s0003.1
MEPPIVTPSPCLPQLLTKLNAAKELVEVEPRDLQEIVTTVVSLWRYLTKGTSPESTECRDVVWFAEVGGYDSVTSSLRILLRGRFECTDGGLLNSDWRLAVRCCCDILIAAGQTGKVWPQRSSSMLERAEAVCVPLDVLSTILQDGIGQREGGDVLRLVNVLSAIWQHCHQEIHMLLRHNALQVLSLAIATSELELSLDRLAASSLLSDVLCSLEVQKLRYKLPLPEVAGTLLRALRLAVQYGEKYMADKAIRNVVTCLQAIVHLPGGCESLQEAALECGGMHILQRLLGRTQEATLRRDIRLLLQGLAPPSMSFSRAEEPPEGSTILASFPHLSFLASCMSWISSPMPEVDTGC